MKTKIFAPVAGVTVPLEFVPDAMFAQKILGNGVAVDPTENVIVAPCAGVVSHVHAHRHALTLTTETGAQLLLHVGIDTVQLKGEGYTAFVTTGDKVSLGQKLLSFDADLIAQRAKSLMTILIVTDPTSSKIEILAGEIVAAGEALFAFEGAAEAKEKSVEASVKSAPVKVTLKNGLHARPAGLIAAKAKQHEGAVQLGKNGKFANAKSVTALLELQVEFNDEVSFAAEGSGAEAAVASLREFLAGMREEAHAAPLIKRTVGGIGLSSGRAFGRVVHVRPHFFSFDTLSKLTPELEQQNLRQGLSAADEELRVLALRSEIFSAHRELLADPELLKECSNLILQGNTAAFAWSRTLNHQAERLQRSTSTLLAERATDCRDVRDRVLAKLGAERTAPKIPDFEEIILVGEHLTPSDTVAIERDRVVGFATTTGGASSHVAILARSMGIPAVAGLERSILNLQEGTEVVLDGDRGLVRTANGESEKQEVRSAQNRLKQQRKAALELGKRPAITRDGHKVEVHANINNIQEARTASSMGADGVGLFRTEFLFLERATAPSEDEQLALYQEMADIFGEKPLTIRTLDVGGDKPLSYLQQPKEDNPFLGVRGFRLSLRHEDMLRQQIRAVLRVKSSRPLNLMFPMISTLEEFREAKRIVDEESRRLKAPPISVGIMMEVPSVAVMAEAFAREVDFFSIGTNDLTQYALAMDRGNSELAKQSDGLHPSILKLIELTVQAAHAHGKWVGVCGALASDPKAVPILVGLGVDELSAGLMSVSQVKAQVRELSLSETKVLARMAVQSSSAFEVRNLGAVEL
jgi:phosphoenolpyruvate-protein phosphotransferase